DAVSRRIADVVVVDVGVKRRGIRVGRRPIGADADARRVRGVVRVDGVEGDDALAGVRAAAGVVPELAAGDADALHVADVVGLTARADAEKGVAQAAAGELDAVA